MKKLIFILTATISTFSFSCSEDPDDVNVIESKGSLTVDVTGSSEVMFVDDTLAAYTHSGLLIVKATDTDENNIWIMFDTKKITTMVGDHNVARLNDEVQINFNMPGISTYYSAESGTVTVTEYDGQIIKGTFSFEAKNFSKQSEVISGKNGKFTGVME